MMSNPNPSELGDRLGPLASGKLRRKPWKENTGYTESGQAQFTRKNLDEKPRVQGGDPEDTPQTEEGESRRGKHCARSNLFGESGGQ